MSDSRHTSIDRAPRVLVIGSINMDLVVRVDQMPRPGQTVAGQSFDTIPGGKGANQAVAAARIAGASRMVGRVGDDVFGQRLLGHLASLNVDTEYIQITHDCPSGVATICVDRNAENAITVVAGANGHLSRDDVLSLEPVIAAADVVVLQLEIPIATVSAALQVARQREVFTILDPAPAPTDPLPSDLHHVDIFTPNRSEAESLTGVTVSNAADAERAGRLLIDRGADSVVLKLGADGALIVARDAPAIAVPAKKVDVLDTTAAGDAFTGAMAVAIAEGRPLSSAVEIGCAAGALACTRLGAQWSMPERREVEELLNQQ